MRGRRGKVLSGGDPHSQARLDSTRDRMEPKIRRIFCSAPTAGKRRIYYGRFHGISLDRPRPSEKTPGPPELIIRRVHAASLVFVTGADADAIVFAGGNRQPFSESGPAMIKGICPDETNSTNLFICRVYHLSRLIARPLSLTVPIDASVADRLSDRPGCAIDLMTIDPYFLIPRD